MKKLRLEAFFHPGSHDDDAEGHRFVRQPREVGSSTYPYTEPAGETMTDEEIEEELGLDENLSIMEFYKAGPTQPGGYGYSGGKKPNSGGGFSGGKSSKGFGNFMKKTPKVNPKSVAKTRSLPISWLNEPDADEKEFDKYFELDESYGAGTREKATKELAPVSTKKPFVNGIPSSPQNLTTKDDVDPRKEKKMLEKEVGLSLESLVKEWADTDWSRNMQTKKAKGEEDDLFFFDILSTPHRFLMNTEEEFREEQKRKKEENESKKQKKSK